MKGAILLCNPFGCSVLHCNKTEFSFFLLCLGGNSGFSVWEPNSMCPHLLLPYAQRHRSSFFMLCCRHSVRHHHCHRLFLRFLGYFCYPLPLRDGKSGSHRPPWKICIATALSWRWSENPSLPSAMGPPWQIIDNTDFKRLDAYHYLAH